MPTGNEADTLNYTYTTSTGCGEMARIGMTCPPPSQTVSITRQRVLELYKLAFDCLAYLEKEGLVSQEWCIFGDMIKNLHNYSHPKPLAKKGRKHAAVKQ